MWEWEKHFWSIGWSTDLECRSGPLPGLGDMSLSVYVPREEKFIVIVEEGKRLNYCFCDETAVPGS